MKKKLKELKEQANELINFGNSHEKSTGYGMIEVIKQIKRELKGGK